ncbi:MAG: hypothetical protein JOZ78_24375 [Chroococcidiopsidaceae cyanobacterium CP_BM_ER_R8_30]|nr:hypothetical protein [Chroococcidiopsidaceae cyanobacterium CP_BM_ER_R8_30]
MREKILQAVILTFILKVAVGMNSLSASERHFTLTLHRISAPIASLVQHRWR